MAAKKTPQPKTPTTTIPAKTAALAKPATPVTLAVPPKAAKAAKAALPTKVATPTKAAKSAKTAAPAKVALRTKAAPPVVTPVAAAPERPRVTVTHEDIRVRAYYLALEHGGKGGNLDFWLLAERELRTRATTGD